MQECRSTRGYLGAVGWLYSTMIATIRTVSVAIEALEDRPDALIQDPSSSSSLLLQLPRRCFDQHRRSLSVRCAHYHRLFPLVLPLILLRPSVLAAQRVDDRDLTLCDADEVRVRCRPKLINHRAQRAAARSLQELRWVARLDDPPLSKHENLISIL